MADSSRPLETILLVEDEPAVRQLFAHALARAGYAVYEARNGQEAMKVFDQHGDAIDLLPFASFDGSWSVQWPYGLVNLPISIDSVPKKWWGAPGPGGRWTAWLGDDTQRPVKLQKLRSLSVFCDMRLAIQTDYMGATF